MFKKLEDFFGRYGFSALKELHRTDSSSDLNGGNNETTSMTNAMIDKVLLRKSFRRSMRDVNHCSDGAAWLLSLTHSILRYGDAWQWRRRLFLSWNGEIMTHLERRESSSWSCISKRTLSLQDKDYLGCSEMQASSFKTHIEIIANISEDKFQQPMITLCCLNRDKYHLSS